MLKAVVRASLPVVLVVTQVVTLTFAGQRPLRLRVQGDDGMSSLSLRNLGNFHSTRNQILDARAVRIPNSEIVIALWNERNAAGHSAPYFAISRDGRTVAQVRETSYDILLRYGRFDPEVRQPQMPQMLAAEDESGVHIVQFVTAPMEEYRERIGALGGTIRKFLANNAYLVEMSAEVRDRVGELPFVRWVGPYHPAYRLEEFLLSSLTSRGFNVPTMRYSIQVFERGMNQQEAVARRVAELGGEVHLTTPMGFRLEATLTPAALMEIVRMDEVQFIDRWSPPEPDMDIARQIGGATLGESAGYIGVGVRGEVMDVGVRLTHLDFQSRPLLVHGSPAVFGSHGTSTTGIVFGDGTANPMGRGMLPGGQGIYANSGEASRRYEHTAELLRAPYFAVFQTNSWGGGLTTQYTTISAEMDDILFDNDITILQSQSNAASQSSRPQAWAKNIVSVGGIRHYNTLTIDDDCWCNGASTGPAADGRIKPDLAHFYDSVFTTTSSSDTAYTTGFGGTSAATPIVAGHFGLFFELWHRLVGGGATVFDSRPRATTAKALLINTARQWPFTGPTGQTRTRVQQGWGYPDLLNLYNLRDQIILINEDVALTPFSTWTYEVQVNPQAGTPLRATLVYSDPSGTTSSTLHRINDLTLRMTSPSGVVYWGNNGLLSGPWSQSGGSANTVDTVENIFIESPEAGVWRFEVIASEINEDGRPETPGIDADFAFAASGIGPRGSAARPFGLQE